MRRFGIAATAAVIVVLLVAFEIIIIKSTSGYESRVKAVFAKVKIPENTLITPDMLELRDVGTSFLHRESLKSISDAASKTSRVEMEQGEMVLSGKLLTDDAAEIELKDQNNRLFSIEFKSDQANGWWLKNDQEADIIFVPDKRVQPFIQQEQAGAAVASSGLQACAAAQTENTGSQAGAVLLPEDAGIQVLKGIRIAALIDENGTVLKETGRNSLPRYVSFEVTTEQADFLAYAKGSGRLELSVIPKK